MILMVSFVILYSSFDILRFAFELLRSLRISQGYLLLTAYWCFLPKREVPGDESLPDPIDELL